MSKKEKSGYAEKIKAIEDIVASIEQGDPDVDKMTEMVEKAYKLIEECKTRLKNTENKLNLIHNENQS